MIRSEIDILLEDLLMGALGKKQPKYFKTSDYAQAIEALITKSNQELLSRVERELPEKYDERNGAVVEISGKKYAQGHNAAIDQTKATIDRIKGEL